MINNKSNKKKKIAYKSKPSLAAAILEEQLNNGVEVKIPIINFSLKKEIESDLNQNLNTLTNCST